MSKAGDPNKKAALSAEELECMQWIASCSTWSVARNNRERLDPSSVKKPLGALKTTGDFHLDYVRYCKVMNLAPHPSLKLLSSEAPDVNATKSKEDAEEEEPILPLNVRHIVLDTGTCSAFFMALKASVVTEITLFSTGLLAEDITELSRVLPKTCVEKLRIEYNPIDTNAEGGDALTCFADLISTKSVLSELSLRGNHLSELHAPSIADALSHSRLNVLNLFDNRLGNDGAAAIAQALRFNMSLKSLSLSKNWIGGDGAHAFASLFSTCTETPELAEGRKVACSVVDEQNKFIADINKKNSRGKVKKKQLDKIEHPEKPVMLKDVETCVGNTSLEYLNLSANGIRDVALDFAQVIAKSKSCKLRGLAINMNHTSPKVIEEVTTLLEKGSFFLYV